MYFVINMIICMVLRSVFRIKCKVFSLISFLGPQRVKPKGSHGYDEIPTKILKLSVPYNLSPLTYSCNLMISTGTFPTWLKFAEIKPIHKKGEKSNISNYRPISLLTSFSKIFEKIIFTRLMHHLSDNHILAKEQFGQLTPVNSVIQHKWH